MGRLAFDGQGKRLASTDWSGGVYLWRLALR